MKTLPNPDPKKVTLVSVQAELDPPTPYEATVRNLAQFRNTPLISIYDGGDHGQFLIDGNDCVNDAVSAYLADGVDLPRHTACAGPRLLRAYPEDLATLYESQVYPVLGPMDCKNGKSSLDDSAKCKPNHGHHGDRQGQRHLQELIGNTGDGKRIQLKLTP